MICTGPIVDLPEKPVRKGSRVWGMISAKGLLDVPATSVFLSISTPSGT
jgi:hypothetical protein